MPPTRFDLVAGRLDEAEQQAGQGRLARAALANDGDDRRPPGIDRQRQVGKGQRAFPAEPAGEALADIDGLDQRQHRSGQMTGDLRAGDIAQCRSFGAVAIGREIAARVEGAARGQLAQGWRQAGDAGERAAPGKPYVPSLVLQEEQSPGVKWATADQSRLASCKAS
jgi:hypothetical protein